MWSISPVVSYGIPELVRNRKNAIHLSLMLLAGAALWSVLARPFIVRTKAQQELTALYDRLTIDQSPDRVRSRFRSGNFSYLNLNEASSKLWAVTTPLSFGGGNWILYIDFNGPNVSGLRVRTADDPKVIPRGAPADK